MPYDPVVPPFKLAFHDMPKGQLAEYREWFLREKPHRMKVLEGAVIETPGFEKWLMDRSPESLKLLGEWFAQNVRTRLRTDDEIERIRSNQRFQIAIPPVDLDYETLSLAFDVGMYLGDVMVKAFPVLRWEQYLKTRRALYFGQMVLLGFHADVPMATVSLANVLAYGIADHTRDGSSLYELFTIRAKNVIS